MLVYAGIDEAGYGPMFGPLTVGCAAFTLERAAACEDEPPSLWKTLQHAVSREIKAARGRIVVNDSKKLKLPNGNEQRHALIHLERGVLSFLVARDADSSPATDDALAAIVAPALAEAMVQCRWYAGDPLAVPVGVDLDALRIGANVLRRSMQRTGVGLAALECHALTEPEFNRHVGLTRSKAATSFTLVGRHLGAIFERYGEHHPHVVVDRQGGRTQYLSPLQTLFPEATVRILAEDDGHSRYELREGERRRMTVTFVEGAEERHLPVALASMLAKYLRELMMIRFNRYFRAAAPEVKPTAGYVEDGRRFLNEIDPWLERLGVDRRGLVRCC